MNDGGNRDDRMGRIGQQVGSYRLLQQLGRGSFAEVYLAENILLKSPVAIKLLLPHMTENKEQFLEEARTVAHLVHPNIVRLLHFDIDTQTNWPYLVMEYAPNGSLRQRYPKGSRLPLPTIVSYVTQAALALQYAHDNKVIHRDVKPENMLLNAHDEVLLSDFGLATLAHSSVSMQTQEEAGTIYYMAPEQIRGKPRPASDQYALAIVVYHWLSGTYPFVGNSIIEIAMQHEDNIPPSLQRAGADISPATEHVIMRALAKDPQHRYESVLAFALAFEQASHPQPQQLQLPSSPPSLYQAQPISLTSNTRFMQEQKGTTGEETTFQVRDRAQQLVGPSKGTEPSVPKRGLSRKVLFIGLISLALLGILGGSWLWIFNGRLPGLVTQSPPTGTITGSIVSINVPAHNVTLSVNGQQLTVDGLTDQQVSALQSQVGKIYTFQVQSNANNGYSMIVGTDPTQYDNGTPQVNVTPQSTTSNNGVNAPGHIYFIGRVQSYSGGTLVVSMPGNQSLAMSVSAQTESNTTPQVGQIVKVDAVANVDGSFMAAKLAATDAASQQDTVLLNTVNFQGVTTQAVGSDNIIHFKVGMKSFTFMIGSTTQIKGFANAQAIGANQGVLVQVLYNGSSTTLQIVSSGP